jgi:hypothetical protein
MPEYRAIGVEVGVGCVRVPRSRVSPKCSFAPYYFPLSEPLLCKQRPQLSHPSIEYGQLRTSHNANPHCKHHRFYVTVSFLRHTYTAPMARLNEPPAVAPQSSAETIEAGVLELQIQHKQLGIDLANNNNFYSQTKIPATEPRACKVSQASATAS